MTLQTQIIIKWKGFMKDPSIYFDCHNINVSDNIDMLVLDFDQKILFGRKIVHRKIYIMKHDIRGLSIRNSIVKMPMEIEN